MPWVVLALAVVASFGLGMLVISVLERRAETTVIEKIVSPVAEFESRSELWGRNHPREHDSFKQTRTEGTRTAFGGSDLRDYLSDDPRQVVLFAGYAFSKDYKQARGHHWAVDDVGKTQRTTRADGSDTGQPGTCWTCKSSDVPRLMNERGIQGFYNNTFAGMKKDIANSIGCLDCHDPRTMNLRVSRPALREAFKRRGRDIDQASHQELRSLVCAQCHVEYYFGNDPGSNAPGAWAFSRKGKYLVFPWDEGTNIEDIEAFWQRRPEYYDWIHPISGARMIKAQHPDWELYATGAHAWRGVSCADCHMPYRSEGAVKLTDHFVQSPLLNIANSCAVCHRASEEEMSTRVEAIQRKTGKLKLQAEDALVLAHFEVAACREAGASEAELKPLRDRLWRAQYRWDFVSASNGMGFHSPQECARILGTVLALCGELRVEAARVLARHGVNEAPVLPAIETRDKAVAAVTAWEKAAANPGAVRPSLLRSRPAAAPTAPAAEATPLAAPSAEPPPAAGPGAEALPALPAPAAPPSAVPAAPGTTG